VLDYEEALRYITSTGRFGIKLGLERTRALLDEAGAPDRGMRGVLVGGTNGKGSTCCFVSAALRQAGIRSAAMPKPHLSAYTERVVVDGEPISEADFAAAVTALRPAIDRVAGAHGAPTEFEILTVLALRYARDRGVDIMVCEVGMGGRLDATNVTQLGVKVITGVALDHQQYLGEDIAAIATEKAGIIHPGDIVVCGVLEPEADAVVRARSDEVGADLWLAERDFRIVASPGDWSGSDFGVVGGAAGTRTMSGMHTAMLGGHQAANAGLAAVALQAMSLRHGLVLPDDAVRAGIAAARWPGRLELFDTRPQVLVDGGHNPDAVRTTVQAVGSLVGAGRPVAVVFGAMADKDTAGMLKLLPADWPAVFTEVSEARALPAAELMSLARSAGRGGDSIEPEVAVALRTARRRVGEGGLVLVLGSLYLAGTARNLLLAGG
jgi:dihydrofolate synthase/folylpolyglutamate synthase